MHWGNMNKEERAKLVRFYLIDKRWSYRQLADYLGVTRNTIAGICNRNSIKIPSHRPKPVPAAPDADNVILFPLISRPSREEAVKDMVKKSAAKLKAKRVAGMQTNAVHRMVGRARDLDSVGEWDTRPLKSEFWNPLPNTAPVAFTETQHWHCRWPVSDDNKLCCGAQVKEGKPYCPTHCNVAYRPAPPLKLRKRRGEKTVAA